MMNFFADLLLASGAFGAALYCCVLSARLRRFTDLEKGVGGAVAVLSGQVDDLTKSLNSAQSAARSSVTQLSDVTARAEAAERKLELLVAAVQDIQPPGVSEKQGNPFFVRNPGLRRAGG